MEGLEDRKLLTTFTVTTRLDGPDVEGSLRQAVEIANATPNTVGEPDVIEFADNVKGTIKLTEGELAITDDLTIDGPSSGKITISGNNASRIFNISGAETDVTIDDLKLVRGFAEDAGGAILHTGQSLSVTNVEFKHNQVVGNDDVLLPGNGAAGGAIAILSPNLELEFRPTATIKDSRFSQNDAFGTNGGAFGGAFGGAISNQGKLTIKSSTLTHNGAFGGSDNNNDNQAPNAFKFVGLAFGGAVNNNNGGTLIMDDCVVTHNQAVAGDRNTGGSATFVGDAGGAGIENIFYSTGEIRNSTIAHNTVVAGDEATTEGDIDGGHAGGGGIGNRFFATLTVENSAITHNRVVGGDRSSGGTGTGGGIQNYLSKLTVYDSDISYNSASGGQDAIGADAGGAYGGGIQNYLLSTLTLENSRLTNNRVTGGSLADGNGAAAGGGGLNNDSANAEIIDSVFSDNRVTGGKGAVGRNGEGGGIRNFNALLTFSGEQSVVKRNHARGGSGSTTNGEGLGGGIYNAASVLATTVPDVFANHASDDGDDLFGLVFP